MAEEQENIVEVRGLRVGFNDHLVLEDLDLEVHRGEVLGIVGGSGSGKSVLLQTILGLLRPRAGSVGVFGRELTELRPLERRSLQRRWGVLFQDAALFSSLTLAGNVRRVITEHADVPEPLLEQLVRLKISMVGLEPATLSQYPAELSGGMRKQAGLARALALDPEILFLDEPTAGLDPLAATAFEDLIKELRRTLKFTVVLVTHDLDTLYAICDRVAVLVDGKIAASGTIEAVSRERHPWIRDFFHGPRGRAAGAQQEERGRAGAAAG
jgi:phospholipid/cholesterol/gamma-HCH transport system ATP-binding protein